jgi:hypothetical protein
VLKHSLSSDLHQFPFHFGIGKPTKCTCWHVGPMHGVGILLQMQFDRLYHFIERRHREVDDHLKPPPDCGVQKLLVIGGSDAQARTRPIINHLKEDRE